MFRAVGETNPSTPAVLSAMADAAAPEPTVIPTNAEPPTTAADGGRKAQGSVGLGVPIRRRSLATLLQSEAEAETKQEQKPKQLSYTRF